MQFHSAFGFYEIFGIFELKKDLWIFWEKRDFDLVA